MTYRFDLPLHERVAKAINAELAKREPGVNLDDDIAEACAGIDWLSLITTADLVDLARASSKREAAA